MEFVKNDGHISTSMKNQVSLLLEGSVVFPLPKVKTRSLALLFPGFSTGKVSTALTSSFHFEMHGYNAALTLLSRLNNNG